MPKLWHVLLYTSSNEHWLFVVQAANMDIAVDMACRRAIALDHTLSFREQFAYEAGDAVLIGKWTR